MTSQLIVYLAICVAVIAGLVAVIAARSGGPRVTHIETRREKKGDDDA